MLSNKSKALRKIIAGSLAVLMLTSGYTVLPMSAGFSGAVITADAADATLSNEGFTYQIIDSAAKTLKLTGYSNLDGVQPETLSIPGTVEMNGNVYTVIELGSVKNYNDAPISGDVDQIKNVILPDTITAINESAFYNFTAMERIEINSGIKTIENHAFSNCSKLADIVIPSGSIEEVGFHVIDNTAFYTNHADGDIIIGDVYFGCKGEQPENTQMVIPEGIRVVAGHLYATKNITSVSFPSTVETIGSQAFDATGIKNLVFPATVKKLYISNNCGFSSDGSYETIDMSQSAIEEMYSSTLGVVYKCSALKTLKLPKKLKALPWLLCNDCPALTTVIMPEEATSFSNYAFQTCPAIETIRFPDSLNYINNNFLGNLENSYSDKSNNLTNLSEYGTVILSSKLNNRINSNECSLSKQFINPSYLQNPQSFGFSMFMEKSDDESYNTITANAFINTEYGSNIKLFIEDGVKVAEGYNVSYFGTFTKDTENMVLTITVNNDLVPQNQPFKMPFKDGQKINYNGDEYTVRLKNVSLFDYTVLENDTIQITGYEGSDKDIVIPSQIEDKDVTEIGDGYGSMIYNEADSVTLPSTVQKINSFAFDQSTIKRINIPSSVTELGRFAFRETNLESLTIPSSVKTFGELYSNKSTDNTLRNLCIYDDSSFEKFKETDYENNEIEKPFFTTVPEKVFVLSSASGSVLEGKPLSDEFTNTYYVQDTVNVSQDFKDSNPNYCLVNINENTKTATVGSEIKRTSTALKVPDTDTEIFINNESYQLVHNIRLLPATESNCLVPGIKEHYEDEEGGCYKLENSNYVPMTEEEIQSLYLEFDPTKHVFGEDGICSICHNAYNNGIGMITGNSLNLDSTIGINFYMDFSDGYAEENPDAYMQFTYKDGTTEKVTVSEAKKESLDDLGNVISTSYCFQCHVAAKEMNDDVTAQFYKADGTAVEGVTQTYSVRKYADYVMNHIEDFEYDFDLIPLIDAMMTYGKYAKNYFNYGDQDDQYSYPQAYLDYIQKSEDEGYIITTAEDDVEVTTADYLYNYNSAVDMKINNSSDGSIKFVGSNLSLNTETVLRLYFDINTDDDIIVRVDDSYEYELIDNGKYKYIEIKDGASAIGTTHSISVYSAEDQSNEAYGKYGVLSYAYLVLSREDSPTRTPELKNLMRALFVYATKGYNYFDQGGGTIEFDDGGELGPGTLG